jgi:hypothetical protein
MKQKVAKPLAKIVVDTWNPVINATRTVAGNITTICCNANKISSTNGGL